MTERGLGNDVDERERFKPVFPAIEPESIRITEYRLQITEGVVVGCHVALVLTPPILHT